MKNLVAVISLCAFALAGCSTQQIKSTVETQIAHDVAVQIAPAAVPDLLKTRDEANAQNPPDTYLANCMSEAAKFIGDLAAQQTPSLFGGALDANGCKASEYFDASTKACKTGVALSAYQLYIAAHAPPAPAPIVPDSLVAACSVPAFKVKLDVASFVAQFGIDLAGLKGSAALGSARTLQAVRAAQAARP